MSRILIVEDDPIILSNLSQLLELSGLDVQEASDGAEALLTLEACRRTPNLRPSLILSDLMMPQIDGFELLATVRKDPDYKNTPFVLLTARSESSDLRQAFDLGATDYLVKPFEIDDLMSLIRRELDKQGTLNAGGGQANQQLVRSGSLFD